MSWRIRTIAWFVNIYCELVLFVVVVFLTLSVFWLPPESSEKFMLSGVTLVMICILLMMISSNVPIMSDRIPLIGKSWISTVLFYNQDKCYALRRTNEKNVQINFFHSRRTVVHFSIITCYVRCILRFTVIFYSNSMGMVTMSMVFSVLLHNLAKSNKPDHKVPRYVSRLLNTKFGTVMRFTSLKVCIIKYLITTFIFYIRYGQSLHLRVDTEIIIIFLFLWKFYRLF